MKVQDTAVTTFKSMLHRMKPEQAIHAAATLMFELPWMLGDLLMATDNPQGLRLSDTQLYDLDRVARLWPVETRSYPLPWSYYRDAGSDMEVAHKILRATVANGWSREQMRHARRMLIARVGEDL